MPGCFDSWSDHCTCLIATKDWMKTQIFPWVRSSLLRFYCHSNVGTSKTNFCHLLLVFHHQHFIWLWSSSSSLKKERVNKVYVNISLLLSLIISTTSKEVTIENPNLYCVLKPIQIQNITSGLSILLIASLSKP